MSECNTSKCKDDDVICMSETAKSREDLRLVVCGGESQRSSRTRSPYLLAQPIDEYDKKHEKEVLNSSKLSKSKEPNRPKTYNY